MQVLGEKKQGLFSKYMTIVILGLIMLGMAIYFITEKYILPGIFISIPGITTLCLGIFFLIDVIKTPKDAIVYYPDRNVLKIVNTEVHLSDIKQVMYNIQIGKSYNNYGIVCVVTNHGRVRSRLVINCDVVASDIYDLLIKYRQEH